MELEARHLRMVCAIADLGSVTRAAAALGMSQPNLTRQIQRLERALGGTLFDRAGSGSVPTALGGHVLARARAVLPALDDLNAEVRDAATGATDIRYGAEAGPLAAGMLPHLRELHPSATVRFRTDSAGALVELVQGGHLDLAAICEFPGYAARVDSGVERQVVCTEPVFVLVAEDHALAHRDELALDELADARWVLQPPSGDRFREYFTDACLTAGFTPDVAYEIDFASARDLISAGQVIGMGQATFRPMPGLCLLPLAGAPLWQSHTLLWRHDGPLAGTGSGLVRAAQEVYRAAISRSRTYLDWLAGHPDFARLIADGRRR